MTRAAIIVILRVIQALVSLAMFYLGYATASDFPHRKRMMFAVAVWLIYWAGTISAIKTKPKRQR